MPLTTVPPARPAGARPARRIATAAAAATLTAGLLLGLSSPAQADPSPSCIGDASDLKFFFENATSDSKAKFCSSSTNVVVAAASEEGGLTLKQGNQLVIDLNGGTLYVTGNNGETVEPVPGITIEFAATLVIINGTVVAAGGDGSEGTESGAGADGKPGILVGVGSTLIITATLSGGSAGGSGGNEGPTDEAGGDGAPGIDYGDQGMLYISAEGPGTSGSDGTGTNGGKGAPVIRNPWLTTAYGCTDANPEQLWLYSKFDNFTIGVVAQHLSSFVNSAWWPVAGPGYTFDHWEAEIDGEPSHWTEAVEDDESSLDDVLAFRAQCQSAQTSSSQPPAPPPSETTTPAPGTSTPTSTPTHTTSAPSSAPLPANLDSANLHLSDHQLPAGSGVTITAHGFAPGSRVHFWIHSTPQYLGSSIAGANGIATLRVTLDPSLVGLHHIQALGIGPHGKTRNLAQPITLTTKALASTGINTTAYLLAVLALIGAGTALLHAGRRPASRQH